MSKKLIQDILVNKKSIRMIKRDSSSVFAPKKEEREINKNKENRDLPEKIRPQNTDFSHPEKIPKRSQIFLWVLSLVLVVILVFLVSSTFSSANIKITPKSEEITLNDTFDASKKPLAGNLGFDVITIKKTASKILETDGEEDAQIKAIGKAILYNNYSTASQRLISNTRLETTEGLIYRIRSSADIPGYKIISGVRTPGSIEVEIIADVAGKEYNMKLTDLKGDFKIPGFKGSQKYTGFYARLSKDVEGGFVGKIKKVSGEKLTTETEILKNSLKESLLKELYEKRPEAYEIFRDNYFVEYVLLPDKQVDSNKYEITVEATMNTIAFKRTDLASFLAKSKIKEFEEMPVDMIWSAETLNVSILNNLPRPWLENTIKIKFEGKTTIFWTYDSKELLDMVVGKNKDIINELVNNKFKPSIENINIIIRPSWKKTFPEKINKIKIFDELKDSEILN